MAKWVTNSINEKYDTHIVIDRVDLSYLGKVRLRGIEIDDHHQDSLIYINKLSTSILSYKNIRDNKFNFGTIDLEGLRFYLKTYKDETNDNLSIFVEKLEGKDTTASENPFLFTTDAIRLKDAWFYLFDQNKSPGPIVYYKDINARIDSFKIAGPNVNAAVRKASFYDNHGLVITDFDTDFRYTKRDMRFENTLIETEMSQLHANIRFDYGIGDLADFNNKVLIDADIADSKIALVDLNKLYSELGVNDKVRFSTHLKGTLNDFTMQDLQLVSNRNSVINGDFHFTNAINTENGFNLQASIDKLSSDYLSLKLLLPNLLGKKLPSVLDKFGRFTIRGNSFITDKDVDAQLNISSLIGASITDLKLTNIDNIDDAKYKGSIELIDLNMGEILQDSIFGDMSLKARVDGKGFTLETINTSIRGIISKYSYKGYAYQDININGILKNQLFDGSLISKDPNLKMNFSGLADFSSETNKFDFTADVEYADFNKLNLFKRDSIAVLKGKIVMNITGNSIDNMAGKISFFNASYTNQNDNYYFKDFNVTSQFEGAVRTITMNSTDIIEGKMRGVFKFEELGRLASNSLESIYTNYNPAKVTSGQFLDFNFKIYNKIVDVFFPQIKLGPNTSIRGSMQSDEGKFELTLRSPSVEAYQNLIENIRLQIDNKNPLYNTLLSVDKIETKEYTMADLNLVNVTLNDTLFFRTNFKGGKDLQDKFDLSFYHTVNENKKFVVGLKKSDILFKANQWVINPANNSQNKVVFDKGAQTFAFDKFNAVSGEQQMDFSGVITGSRDKDLTLNMQHVTLEGITPYIENFEAKGLVNGSIDYKEQNGELFPLANLTINDLYVNSIVQGDFYIIAKGINSLNQYAVQAKLINEDNPVIDITGEVDFTDKRPSVIANYDVEKFNLKTLNALGRDVISKIRGYVSGTGTISGLLENPDIDGTLQLEGAGLAIPYLNVNYDLAGKPGLKLYKQTFEFLPTTMVDVVHDTEATLSGKISHVDFEKWFLDLKINTDNLLVLNTKEQEDELYYGTGFLEGNATIKGPTDQLVIDVEGTTKKGTEFIIPLSDISTVGDSKLINFITEENRNADGNAPKEVVFDKLKGLTLNFDLTVTKDAVAEIVIDKNTGSVLRGSGDGYMRIEINTNGKFDIYGSYVVNNGVYRFRNIVNKDFTVKPGGSVVWNGSPYDAFLNITAIYPTKANPSILLDNFQNSSRKIDVDLIAKITGQLLKSDIAFDIELPNQSSVVNSELQFKLSDEYTKTTEFFALLTLGSFIDLNEGIFGNNSTNKFLNSTLSEKINSVLSGILKSKGDKFEVGVSVDLANKEDVRTYNLSDQLGVSFSSTIGDRLIVNGKVGVPVGGNTQNNIVGEVEVELPLNEEGTLVAKAYTHQNDIEYNLSDVVGYTHGVGLSWRVDFDNYKELISKILSKKNKTVQEKKDSIAIQKKLINFSTEKKDTIPEKK
ncbi:MAG: translocation/assembly module TamB [Flavobacteriaceae bacterium]|nr:translocation/assembly module TamB [Flavobacteriaceae bacterium]